MMVILLIVAQLVALILIVLVVLYFMQSRFIFSPKPCPPEIRERYAADEIGLSHKGVTLRGWFFRSDITDEQPLIIYYGGNAEDISANFADLNRFHTKSFLFMNYRGYGGSDGTPSESALVSDAVFIFDYMVNHYGINPATIILMGRNIGAGIAVNVASQREVSGVILVTPFDSLISVARLHYSILLPMERFLKNRFDTVSLAPQVHAPGLFLTAANDQKLPEQLSTQLSDNWGGPVSTLNIEEADHVSIQTARAYWGAINLFLSTRQQLAESASKKKAKPEVAETTADRGR